MRQVRVGMSGFVTKTSRSPLGVVIFLQRALVPKHPAWEHSQAQVSGKATSCELPAKIHIIGIGDDGFEGLTATARGPDRTRRAAARAANRRFAASRPARPAE